jgi:predicted transcriptional regulator
MKIEGKIRRYFDILDYIEKEQPVKEKIIRKKFNINRSTSRHIIKNLINFKKIKKFEEKEEENKRKVPKYILFSYNPDKEKMKKVIRKKHVSWSNVNKKDFINEVLIECGFNPKIKKYRDIYFEVAPDLLEEQKQDKGEEVANRKFLNELIIKLNSIAQKKGVQNEK